MPNTNKPQTFEAVVDQMTRGVEDWGYCKGAAITFNDDDFEGVEPVIARKALLAAHQSTLNAAVAQATKEARIDELKKLKRANPDITKLYSWKLRGTEQGRLLRLINAHHNLGEYISVELAQLTQQGDSNK